MYSDISYYINFPSGKHEEHVIRRVTNEGACNDPRISVSIINNDINVIHLTPEAHFTLKSVYNDAIIIDSSGHCKKKSNLLSNHIDGGMRCA